MQRSAEAGQSRQTDADSARALTRYVVLSLLLASLVALVVSCAPGTIVDQDTPLRQTTEICDNSEDDDGDNLVDCFDDDCAALCLLEGPGQAPFAVCGESEGDRGRYPVDMIWMLDGSFSMDDERDSVINNLNALAGVLDAMRSNVRVVLLGPSDACVEPPLGGPRCEDSERYMHVKDNTIGNLNTLPAIIAHYPDYELFLRKGSRRVIVAISDDNPNPDKRVEGWPNGVRASEFDKKLKALDPAFNRYVFHSIVGFSSNGGSVPGGCRGATAPGETYLQLTENSGGLKFSVCNSRQDDWRAFFEEVAASVAGLVNVPCQYPRTVLYEPGERTNPDMIMVEAEIEGRNQVLDQFPGPDACGDAYGYYVEGDMINVCPAVCSGLAVTRVTIQHGCPGIEGPD